MWITPYITLVFTAECLSRAISWPRFAARKKYAAPTCILTAALLVILTWIPSHTKAASQNDVCEGEFVTFLNHYANGGLAVFSVLLPVVIFVIVTIYMHLNKDVEIVPRERYSASKVVSYAALNVGQWVSNFLNRLFW